MKELGWFKALVGFFFGVEYRYFVNHGTKEIHDLYVDSIRCRLNMITKGSYVTGRKVNKLLAKGYNGCAYCYKEKDNG